MEQRTTDTIRFIYTKELPTLCDAEAEDVIQDVWESEALTRLMKKHLTGISIKTFQSEFEELIENTMVKLGMVDGAKVEMDFIELNGAEARDA